MLQATIQGIDLSFQTDPTVFSPSGIDAGTLAMLSLVSLQETDRVLDLGCGYGCVGIWAAKQIGADRVILCDISEKAVKLARENARLNGLPGLSVRVSDAYAAVPEMDLTLILSNPPYHTDFAVAKTFIETGYRKLALGGQMLMVTKRRKWYQNKLASVFGGVQVREINGYFVFLAEKRPKPIASSKPKKPPKLSKKLARKYGQRS